VRVPAFHSIAGIRPLVCRIWAENSLKLLRSRRQELFLIASPGHSILGV
jgi:hypothetical protein